MAGYDSPDVQAELAAVDEQLRAAFAVMADALREIGRMMTEAFAPIMRSVTRVYRQLRAAHLIPRQYRDTMMRRKIRRYVLLVLRN